MLAGKIPTLCGFYIKMLKQGRRLQPSENFNTGIMFREILAEKYT